MKHNTPPKDSFVDHDGKRWTFAFFDVMTANGTKFLRQVKVKLGVHFDFTTGRYVTDQRIGQPLVTEIIRQYPSLTQYRNISFIYTQNKLLR